MTQFSKNMDEHESSRQFFGEFGDASCLSNWQGFLGNSRLCENKLEFKTSVVNLTMELVFAALLKGHGNVTTQRFMLASPCFSTSFLHRCSTCLEGREHVLIMWQVKAKGAYEDRSSTISEACVERCFWFYVQKDVVIEDLFQDKKKRY